MITLTDKSVTVLLTAALVAALYWLVSRPGPEAIAATLTAAATLAAQVYAQLRSLRKLTLFMGSGRPFERTEPADATDLAFRYFSVGVENVGSQDLDNCIVKLERIKAADGRDFDNVFTPIGLLTQQQHLQARPGGVFRLRQGETKYVRVAALDERTAGSEIVLPYETASVPNTIPRGAYILLLRAYGGGSPADLQIRLEARSDGRLSARASTTSNDA